jgi:hypothetical protein
MLVLLLGLWLLLYAGVIVQMIAHHIGAMPIHGPSPSRPMTLGHILAFAGGGLVPPAILMFIYCGYGLHRDFVIAFEPSREEYRVRRRCWGWTTARQTIGADGSYWVAQVTIRETPTSAQQPFLDRFIIASLAFAGPIGMLLQWLNRWADRRMDRFAQEHPLSVGLIRLALLDAEHRERLIVESTDIGIADRFLKLCGIELDWDRAVLQ